MKALKLKLKELAGTQKELKNQRKSVKIVGERTMEAWQACLTHSSNREKLRLMYAAYGLLRGKSFSETENHHEEKNHPLYAYKSTIDKLVQQYEEIVCISE